MVHPSLPERPLKNRHQFLYLGICLFPGFAAHCIGDTVVHMFLQDLLADSPERRLSGLNLGNDVYAVLALFHHSLDALDLPLDPGKASQVFVMSRSALFSVFHAPIVYPEGVYCKNFPSGR